MSPLPLNDFFEPIFYRFEDGYWSGNCPDVDKMEDYLVTRIRRNQRDLDSHVRRILLNIEFYRKPQLIGALQDLYLAFDKQSEPIKYNLLNRSQAVLSSDGLLPFRQVTGQKKNYVPIKSDYSYLYHEPVFAALQKNI